jgi:hypothetical protein
MNQIYSIILKPLTMGVKNMDEVENTSSKVDA